MPTSSSWLACSIYSTRRVHLAVVTQPACSAGHLTRRIVGDSRGRFLVMLVIAVPAPSLGQRRHAAAESADSTVMGAFAQAPDLFNARRTLESVAHSVPRASVGLPCRASGRLQVGSLKACLTGRCLLRRSAEACKGL